MAEKEVYINVELDLNGDKFEKELEDIEKKVKPIEIPVELDFKEVKEIVEEATNVVKEINKAVSGINSAVKSFTGVSDIEEGLKKVLKSINQQLENAVKGALNVLIAPLKETFTGIFNQVGMSIVQAFSGSLVGSIEKSFNASLEQLGMNAGEVLSKFLKQIFNKSNQSTGAPPPTEQVPDLYKSIFKEVVSSSKAKNVDLNNIPKLSGDLEEGAAAKYSQKNNTIHLNKSDYDKLSKGQIDVLGVDNLVHEFRHALQLNFGKGGAKLGVNLLRGTQQELNELEKSINASTSKASQGQSKEVAEKIRKLETDAYVFAMRNAERIYKQVTGQSSAKLTGTQKQIASAFKKSQQQVLDKVSKSNLQALEQLTKTQLIAIAKNAGISNYSGLNKAVLRDKVFSGISADKLSFLIPTFSKPKAEVAKLAQELIGKTGKDLTNSVKAFSQEIRTSIKKNTKKPDTQALTQALDKVQKQRQIYAAALAQNIDEDSRKFIQSAIASLGRQRVALQSRLDLVRYAQINQQMGSAGAAVPQNVELYSVGGRSNLPTPPPPPGFRQNFEQRVNFGYENVGRKVFNSPQLASLPEGERLSMIAEAVGYMFSGGAMAAPIQTAFAGLAPIAIPLTPIIATGALVANVVTPIVAAVQDALRKIEPIKRRFESIAGKTGAKQEEQFARGIAKEFNLNTLTSIDAYSKLFAATKNTDLEGEDTRELFEGISLAIKALGMDSESARLTMYAFTQMAAKGTISMEELRQQLGEKFPPAMDIFAKAAGVPQSELGTLVESGRLLASDILPKVARQLKSQYGGAVLGATNDFITAQVRLENAIFSFQEKLAAAFGPVVTFGTDVFASLVGIVGDNMEKISKIIRVVIIGLGAQFLVGTTVILGKLGLIQKAITVIAPAFGAMMAALTPMFVGIFTDMLDDIFKVKNAIHSISMGFYNFFASIATVIIGVGAKLQEAFENIVGGGGPAIDILGGLWNILKAIRKMIPNVVVQWVSLTLMLAQTVALLKMALLPIMADLILSLKKVGLSFIATARSGKLFQVSLNTLSAGLKSAQFAMVAATAAFLLFFSKAKFVNEIGKSFDEMATVTEASTNKVLDSLGLLESKLDKLKKKNKELKDDFASQGFDLTFGIGEQFGGGAFRTDDVIKMLRGDGEFEAALKAGRITQEQYNEYTFNTRETFATFAEKLHNENVIKLAGFREQVGDYIDSIGLLTNQYKSGKLGKSIEQVTKLDKSIKQLQQRRVDLVSREDFDVNLNVKNAVANLDTNIKQLLGQRQTAINAFKQVSGQFDLYEAEIQKQIDFIDRRTDIPKSAKEQLKGTLNGALQEILTAKNRLNSLNIDIKPNLGVNFGELSKQISAENIVLERSLKKLDIVLQKQDLINNKYVNLGEITPGFASQVKAEKEQQVLEARVKGLSKFIDQRKQQLKQLMLLPEPTKDQRDIIVKNQKLILNKEAELLKNQVSLEKKKAEIAKKAQEERKKDFEEAATIQESYRKAGLVDEQLAIEAILTIKQSGAEEELKLIREKRTKLNKADKEGLEALAVQEAAVYQKIYEINKTRFDEQFKLIKDATLRAKAFIQAEQQQGLRSEQEAAKSIISVQQQSAASQLKFLQQRLDKLPKTATAERDAIIVQQQQIIAEVAKSRKTAYSASVNALRKNLELDNAINQANFNEKMVSEKEFNQTQLDTKLRFYDKQLDLIKKRRHELNSADTDGQKELDIEQNKIFAARAQAQQDFLNQRKAAFEKEISELKTVNEQRLKILEGNYSQGNISVQEFNKTRLNIVENSLNEELRLLEKRRSELKDTDVKLLDEIAVKEAAIYKRRTEAQKQFVSAQLNQLNKQQNKSQQLLTLSEKQREIEIAQLIKSGAITKEQAEDKKLKAAKIRIQEEIKLETQKFDKLNSLNTFGNAQLEQDRQDKLRSSRIKLADLQLRLVQNEISQQQKLSKLYDKLINKITNKGRVAELELSKELRLNNALTKSLETQSKLLDASKNLLSAKISLQDADFKVLEASTKSESKKKELAEIAASAKLQAAKLQIEMDRQSLELQIQQTAAAQQRLEAENAIALIKNRSEIAKAEVNQAKLKADPESSREDIAAAGIDVLAAREEREKLLEMRDVLVGQRATNAQIAEMQRRSFKFDSETKLTNAELTAALAINSKGTRRKKLEELRKESQQRQFGSSSKQSMEAFQRSERGYYTTPLQDYLASQVRKNLTVEIAKPKPVTAQPLENLQKSTDKFDGAVDKLVNMVNSRLSVPIEQNNQINNYFQGKDSTQKVAKDSTSAIRKEMYDLAVELNR